ncbi:MAG: kynureninase [Rhizobiaceae bacterium]|nr:kynureninase [Rhizobiaceae bacterium]
MTDPFVRTRGLFDLPPGIVYLDGNSLGPLPKSVPERLQREIATEWGRKLIGGWNLSGWYRLPETVGDKIARLIGAPPGSVVAGDSTSVNLHKALTAALSMTDRKVVLSDTGNFPTDLYVAQMALAALGRGHELKLVAPEDVAVAIDGEVAVLMLTEVDYRTGRLHDMKALTAKAHAAGALTIWDLAHSAGALPVDLLGAGADFAVGCGYKYLNGGPGAPAFTYVRPGAAEAAQPAVAGWMGHEAPFAFDTDYRPAPGSTRMRVGTPPILSMAALDAALDAWNSIDMADVRSASIALSELFIAEVERSCPGLVLASPRDPKHRGSQVSFRHAHGYAVMQALIARGVIGDFRAPDIMRFGFTPLYLRGEDVRQAAATLADILAGASWDRPEFHARAAVT